MRVGIGPGCPSRLCEEGKRWRRALHPGENPQARRHEASGHPTRIPGGWVQADGAYGRAGLMSYS